MTQVKVNLPPHRVMRAYRPRAIRSKNRAQSWGYGVLYIMRRPLQSVSIIMLSNSSRTRPKKAGYERRRPLILSWFRTLRYNNEFKGFVEARPKSYYSIEDMFSVRIFGGRRDIRTYLKNLGCFGSYPTILWRQ